MADGGWSLAREKKGKFSAGAGILNPFPSPIEGDGKGVNVREGWWVLGFISRSEMPAGATLGGAADVA